MKRKNKYYAVMIFMAIFISIIWKPAVVSAWGDNSGLENGRPEYTEAQINNGDLGGTITFNSISDGVIGHEFNFVGAREVIEVNDGEEKFWNDDIAVEDGKIYIVRMYIHNNNPGGVNAVATDTHVSFSVPGASDSNNQIQVVGFVNSPDATPTEVYDHVNFNSDQPFHLEYVEGSALLENNGIGSAERNGGIPGVQISDEIVNAAAGGIKIGYDTINDGNIPGGYKFSSYITIELKVVYDPEYTIQTKVRPAGTKGDNWTDNLETNIGDELEYQIVYKNISDETQYDVMLRDLLPNNVDFVSGTTKIWNDFFEGDTFDSDRLFTEEGINLGNYGPGANAIIRFNAKVVDKNLACGSNTLVNWGQGTVNNSLIRDSANLTVQKIDKTKIAITMLFILLMISNIRLRLKLRSYE